MSNTSIYDRDKKFEDNEESIIDSINAQLTGKLRPFDVNSEKIFYQYVNTSDIDRSAFSYNWPYIIQATRGHGFYYHLKNSIIYLYLRKCSNNPRNFQLIVVNQLGHLPQVLICEIANAAKSHNIFTLIKNVDPNHIPIWNNLGFKETVEPWSQYSFRDDNSFPEFVYDIDKFLKKDFSSRTRTLINKFAREYNFNIVLYNDSLKEICIDLLEKNSEYLEKKNVDFKNEVIHAHNFVFDDAIRNKTRLAILEGDKLVGLSFITQVNENLFFNAIINENSANLMRYLLWKTIAHYCENLEANKRPLYLALQGSENEGQNRWKAFFGPIRTIQRTHLTNY